MSEEKRVRSRAALRHEVRKAVWIGVADNAALFAAAGASLRGVVKAVNEATEVIVSQIEREADASGGDE